MRVFKQPRFWLILGAAGLILAFCLLIWPTPYDRFSQGSVVYRTHRITSCVQILSSKGWYTITESVRCLGKKEFDRRVKEAEEEAARIRREQRWREGRW